MSVGPSPSSEEPKPNSADDSSGEDMPQEGQFPLPDGTEMHDLADTSSLPKATMPVPLTPNPADPGASPEAATSGEETPAQTPQAATEDVPVPSSKPPGFGG